MRLKRIDTNTISPTRLNAIDRSASRAKRAAALAGAAAAAVALFSSASSCRANTGDGPAAADHTPSVYIALPGSLRDAGGASYKGPDGKPLTERLVSALREAITTYARRHYSFGDPTVNPAEGATHFTLEGELSALEIGEPASRKYMLITRLYRDGKPRKLVAQFAGNAQSLRDLTGNMTHQSGISNLGLTGEMAHEILDAAENARPLGDSFEEMVRSATQARRVTVDVMNEINGKQQPRQTLAPGDRFRLRVNSQDAGAVYIVAIDPITKRPMSPYAQNEPLDAAPGQPVMLPPNEPFTAPRTSKVTTLQYLIFVRKHIADPEKSKEEKSASRNSPLVPGTWPTAAVLPKSDVCAMPAPPAERTTARGLETTSSPIELLTSTIPPGEGTLTPGVAAMLSQYQRDPDGTWTGVKVTITVSPSAPGETVGSEGSASKPASAPAGGTAAPR